MDPQARLDSFAWLSASAPVELHWTCKLGSAADKAAAEGRIQVLAFLAESVHEPHYSGWNRETLGTSQCQAAARAGQIAVLAWLHDHVDSRSWTSDVCRAAVRANQMEALHWLRCICKPPCACDSEVLAEVARRGQLDIIQLLRSTQPPCPWNSDVCTAAVSHPGCLKWLRQQEPPCPWGPGALKAAARTGDLELMKWMRSRGKDSCPWHEECTAIAVKARDLSLLKWMRAGDDPCPFDWWCMDHAAAIGDLTMMDWLYQHDPTTVKCGFGSMSAAVQHGHLAAVQWLRHRQCPWEFGCLESAAVGGARNNQLVQFMLSGDEPCPWEPVIIHTYAAAGNLSMLQWLHTAGYQADMMAAVYAAQEGHLPALAWLLGMQDKLREQQKRSKPGRATSIYNTLPRASLESWPVPALMLWADTSHVKLAAEPQKQQLQLARATYCALHGLIRWRQKQLQLSSSSSSSSSKVSKSDISNLHSSPCAGQQLLTHLAKLPRDLVIRIAAAADLQHDQPVPKCHV